MKVQLWWVDRSCPVYPSRSSGRVDICSSGHYSSWGSCSASLMRRNSAITHTVMTKFPVPFRLRARRQNLYLLPLHPLYPYRPCPLWPPCSHKRFRRLYREYTTTAKPELPLLSFFEPRAHLGRGMIYRKQRKNYDDTVHLFSGGLSCAAVTR